MALFGLLSKKSPVEKYVKKATMKHSQSPERYGAMYKLRDLATDESLYGLAKRFSIMASKGIEDEQEKDWVCETLIALGDKSYEPIKKYIVDATSVAYPLRVLEGIAAEDQILAVVDAVFEREDPEYTRDPSKKIQVITWLGELENGDATKIAPRLVPYLADFDENVRFATVEALSHKADEDSVKNPLIDALCSDQEESRRLKVRIASALAEAAWRVSDRKQEIIPILADDLPEFGLQKDRLVRKKGK